MYSAEVVGTREGEGTTKLLTISIFSFSLKKVIQNMIEKIYSYLSNFTIISMPQTYLDKHKCLTEVDSYPILTITG